MRRSLIDALFCALMVAVPLAASGHLIGAVEGRDTYTNRDYFFHVTVPRDTKYTQAKEPNPNHGFSVEVNSDVSVWVDASSTDSLSTIAAVQAESAGCQQTQKHRVMLGGKRAYDLELSCPVTGSPRRYREKRVLTVTSPPGLGSTCYQVVLRSKNEDIDPKAEKLFYQLVKGFHFNAP